MPPARIEIAFFLGLLLIALGLLLALFLPYFGALLLGATLAVVFYPLYRYLHERVLPWEGIAAFITILIALVIVFTPLTFIGLELFDEARDLYLRITGAGDDHIGRAITMAQDSIASFFPGLSLDLRGYFTQALSWLIQNLGSVFSGATQVITNVFLGLLALYYFLKDGERLKRRLFALSPLSEHHDREIFERLRLMINSVVKGTLFVALIQGVLVSVGFALFSVPHPLLWGVIAVVAALIPLFGTALIVLPAVSFLFLAGNTAGGIGLLIWGVLVVGMVDNILRPYLIKREVSVHPLLILLSVLGGIRLIGPLGFLVGPLIVSLLFTLLDIYPHLILGTEKHPE